MLGEKSGAMSNRLVVDASVMVDTLIGSLPETLLDDFSEYSLHAPAHITLEVFSALGRMNRSKNIDSEQVAISISRLQVKVNESFTLHHLTSLLPGAWERRHNLRLADALYVELAFQLDARVITVDRGMAASSLSLHVADL